MSTTQRLTVTATLLVPVGWDHEHVLDADEYDPTGARCGPRRLVDHLGLYLGAALEGLYTEADEAHPALEGVTVAES